MDQIVDITLPTALICLGVYFVVLFFQYVARKVWASTKNKTVRWAIKWVGTMWLPLWPIAIGAAGARFVPSIPMPKMILELSPDRGITWTIYGAFCGLISVAVVKAIKQLLEKKGIDLEMPDLAEAKLAAKESMRPKPKEDSELDSEKELEESDPGEDEPKKSDPDGDDLEEESEEEESEDKPDKPKKD